MKHLLWISLGWIAWVLPQEPASSPGPGVQRSSSCARCHSSASGASGMRDAAGRAIGPFDLWQGTMMANSARDPLWRAVVSAEVAATPSRRVEIETKCLSCHTPMAHQVGLEEHGTGSLMHVLDCDSALGELARDGVSCTVCHGMSPEGLGTEKSFSAGYELDPERRLFGPHRSPFAMPMRNLTGFTPTYGAHITESSLCGSCHTLVTDAYDPDGHAVGVQLLEQAPYLEWLNSDYSGDGTLGASCQDCHVPTVDEEGDLIQTRIARNPGGFDFPPTSPRSPFGRHVFVGGNTLVLSLFRDHAQALGVQAAPAAIEATLAATRDQLRNRTARVAIENVRHEGRRLEFDVDVENLTGHKLPSAHPTRRAWLCVVVRDGDGNVLLASGVPDERGRVLGADGKPLASELAGGPIDPHTTVVRSADEVTQYRATMADAGGQPTHTLMRGASWLVDDRLLPKGWSHEHEQAHRTAPVGVEGDDDFTAGRDRVRFEIDGEIDGPFTIQAALLYQTLSARWAAELLRWKTPEVEAFRRMYESADLTPEVLASETWSK